MNILFVCTGNTCRSPMAEALFRQRVEGLSIEVKSAGVAAYDGQRASAHAEEVLRKRGIAHNHLAKRVDEQLVAWADLILTMTHSHKAVILQFFPHSNGKLYTLNEYIGEAGDIADPYGGDFLAYQQCAEEMERSLEKLTERLRNR